MEHKDFFGQVLEVDDFVISGWNISGEPSIALYKILDFTSNSIKVVRVGSKKPKPAHRRAKNLVKIDPSLVTYRQLRQ